MQALQPFAITAPGFYGLNVQDSPTDLESGFALTATNCIIDQYGRVGSRKGWLPLHTTLAALGSANVEAIGEHTDTNGVSTTIVAGNNKLFKLSGGVLTELTYGGGGVAPIITASKWSMESLDGYFLLFQEGYDPLTYIPSVSTTTYRRLSEAVGYSGTVQQANCVLSAYGRLWNASTTTNKVTVQWCDVKNPVKWNTGTAGTLDLTAVWPHGGDAIIGLGAHNNKLFIFGKEHILIYEGAATPSTMTLDDAINGIGAISRDSIVTTGSDIIFLSRTGVRSVTRTIQEKSAPLRDLSKNVRNDLMANLVNEVEANVFAVWSPKEAFYLLQFPVMGISYVFDTKQSLQDGAARVTTWDGIAPKSAYSKRDGTLLLGQGGYVAEYTGYYDNTSSYRMSYFSTYIDFGTPLITSIIKKINVTMIGGNNQDVTIKWSYDFTQGYGSQQQRISSSSLAQYNIGQYGINEYGSGNVITAMSAQGTGSGKSAQIGIETDIYGYALSIQKLEVYAKNGKLS